MSPSGDRGEGWFTSVYASHYPDIVRYAFRRLADRDAAMELAQEVFVIAWRRRDQVPDRRLPWLYGVARRLLANEWRARRTRPVPLPLADPDPAAAGPGTPQPESAVAITDLHRALATLSDLDQEILRLVGWEQLTVAEAATVLDCTRTAAAVRLHRARRRLAEALSTPNPLADSRPAVTRRY